MSANIVAKVPDPKTIPSATYLAEATAVTLIILPAIPP